MTRRRDRPELLLEMGPLGTVDPFRLVLGEDPPGSGRHFVAAAESGAPRAPLAMAGLSLVGAGKALLGLSIRWLGEAGREIEQAPLPPCGEVRMLFKPKEARLLASLLRRHLDRLPEPPDWMPELLRALIQMEEFLRWSST